MTEIIKIYCLRTDQLAELDWDGHTVTAWECPYCGTISFGDSAWHIIDPSEPLINRLENSSPVGVLKFKTDLDPETIDRLKREWGKTILITPTDWSDVAVLESPAIRFYCETCGDYRPVEIEPLTRDTDHSDLYIWGDIVCAKCHMVMVTISADEEGIYQLIKVAPLPAAIEESRIS